MPTASGAETNAEKLARLRTELTRVRALIARHETNAQSYNIGGTAVTEVAYERAIKREAQLEQQVALLEAKLDGITPRSILVRTVTVMP